VVNPATGKAFARAPLLSLMASCAGTLKRFTLELGGSDAAIMLDDLDPRAVAPKLFCAAFVNSSQVCMAVKRIYARKHLRGTERRAGRAHPGRRPGARRSGVFFPSDSRGLMPG
jgi:acyl-CoA reductase-like NAD-dependent aldehyde dehydrogenase